MLTFSRACPLARVPLFAHNTLHPHLFLTLLSPFSHLHFLTFIFFSPSSFSHPHLFLASIISALPFPPQILFISFSSHLHLTFHPSFPRPSLTDFLHRPVFSPSEHLYSRVSFPETISISHHVSTTQNL
jgi:hypothetical protein